MFYGVILSLHVAVPASTFPLRQPTILYDLLQSGVIAVQSQI